MHERPQLHHVILQGCSRQEQPPPRVESEEGLPALTLEILDVLGLVQNHVIPLFASEDKVVLNHQLVRRDAHMERVIFAPALALELTFLLCPEVSEDL